MGRLIDKLTYYYEDFQEKEGRNELSWRQLS